MLTEERSELLGATNAVLQEMEAPAWATRSCPTCKGSPTDRLETTNSLELRRCRGCGVVFLAASPGDQALFQREGTPVFERLGRAAGVGSLAEMAAAEEEAAPSVLALIASFRPGGWLLHAGASTGALIGLASRPGLTLEGLEPSPARRRLAQARGVTPREGDPRDGALPRGAFRTVVVDGYLERVTDPVAVLAACRRCIAPSGLVFVATDLTRGHDEPLSPLQLRQFAALRILNAFTAGALVRACEAASLRIVDCYSPDGQRLFAIGEPR